MKMKIIALSLTAVLSSASVAVVANTLLLIGPLQSYNARTGTAVILGQNVSVGARSLPEAGYTVAVFGTINGDGSLNVSSISAADVWVRSRSSVV